jgi:DNA repair exonuclease SbcCD ATPase subunit
VISDHSAFIANGSFSPPSDLRAMTMTSLKWCIVGVAMLSSLAEAGDSMVCGKPSIRDVLHKANDDMSEQNWADIAKTAEKQLTLMAKLVSDTNQELIDLEAKIAAKAGESTPSMLDAAQSKALIAKAFVAGGTSFQSAADAAHYDCGFGQNAWEDPDKEEEIMGYFDTAKTAFAKVAETELKPNSKAIDRSVFAAACKELLSEGNPDDFMTCADTCFEFVELAKTHSAVEGNAMGSPTYAELVVMAEKKRADLERAENDHKECVDSAATINGLYTQFVAASAVLVKQKRTCGRTNRMLRMTQNKLRVKTAEWQVKTEEDRQAQKELKEAIELQDEARVNKEDAAENLRMWEEHMAALVKAIEEQSKVVRQTAEALRAADAASAAVARFKDTLSTALNGLVDYYDEAVRQPLRSMGIREEVNLEDSFPTPSDTTASSNLKDGLEATKAFCAKHMGDLAKLPEIEADGAKLTSICDSQNWDVVAGEVDAAVTARRQSSVANLKLAQQKVKSYSGVLANKDEGEVEGVWKALAIYGDTDFSKNYLSGWRFAQDGAKKGAAAGMMMELASALNKARERAAQLWEEAKAQLAVLEEEKVQVEQILEVAREYLKEMIAEYEKATENRIKADEKAAKARAALEVVTAEKVKLETTVKEIKQDIADLDAAVVEANKTLKDTHNTALGSFMELLHASEQKGGDSWD